MFFRVAASVNEMFVYAWLRPALFKSSYLIADRFKLFWKIMSGISTNYVGDLKRMMYMHVFDCFLMHFGMAFMSRHRTWVHSKFCHSFDSLLCLPCSDLGIWFKNCIYFFPHCVIMVLVFLSLVLHVILSFSGEGWLLCILVVFLIAKFLSCISNLECIYLLLRNYEKKSHVHTFSLLNCPFQSTSSHVWEIWKIR